MENHFREPSKMVNPTQCALPSLCMTDEQLVEWTRRFLAQQQPLDPDFARIVQERFWDLLDDVTLETTKARGGD